MSFTVIIPARQASTRLPGKMLADLGGKPMVVRVAERAVLSGAARVLVATDHIDILDACTQHTVEAVLTRVHHVCGTDRIAEAAARIGLTGDEAIVNVQGDEPLIDPALIAATAARVGGDVPMATAAHALSTIEDVFNPNIVKVVTDRVGCALYFSRAAIPWSCGGFTQTPAQLPDFPVLRHVGLYAYTARFLQEYPTLAPSLLESIEMLEQLRVLWHGIPIAVHICDQQPEAGVDTPDDLLRVRNFFARQP